MQEEFQGQVLHSTSHHSAKDHIGKKVFIIGACTSGVSHHAHALCDNKTLNAPSAFAAHDIAADYVHHGVGACGVLVTQTRSI